MPYRSIRVVTNGIFFVKAESYSTTLTFHNLFHHSIINGYLDHLHILAVVNHASMEGIWMLISVPVQKPRIGIPESGTPG